MTGITEPLTLNSRNFREEIFRRWIQPELDRRFGDNGIPKDFTISKVLILLPSGRPPIVQFDKEIKWGVDVELAPNVHLEKGDEPLLYEFTRVLSFNPPKLEGRWVSFIYAFWVGNQLTAHFDFRPAHTDFEKHEGDYHLPCGVSDHLNKEMMDKIAWLATHAKSELGKIGLWIVPALFPFPISKIIERISAGETDEARQVLLDCVDRNFIAKKLVHTWHIIEAFELRRDAFNEALSAHEQGMYHASITTLIGHIEGVIVDWLHEILPVEDIKPRTLSRLEQFHTVLKMIPHLEYMYEEALESSLEFLKRDDNAPTPFQAFKNWQDKIDPNFAARHAIQHGKYIPEIYTVENSVKLFLLLDTICQFMIFYEENVLNKDFGSVSFTDGQVTFSD